MGCGGIWGGAGGSDGNGGARGNMSDRTGGVAAASPTNGAERRRRAKLVLAFWVGTHAATIHRMHIKRWHSFGELIGPVAPPWASVLSRLGV